MSQGFSRMLTLSMLMLVSGTITVPDSAFGERGKLEKAAAATVSINQAITTATEQVSGTVIEAELEQKHEKLVWKVEVVTAEHKVMEVYIDAETGTILKVEEEKAKKVKRN